MSTSATDRHCQKSADLPVMPAFSTDPASRLFRLGRQRAFVRFRTVAVTAVRPASSRRAGRRTEPHHRRIVAEIADVRPRVRKQCSPAFIWVDMAATLGLDQLIRALLERGTFRAYAWFPEPWDLPESRRTLRKSGFMPLHLPLQSGSDSVLRRMRGAARPPISPAWEQLRKDVPDINITTTYFLPGEMKRNGGEFDLHRRVGFGHIISSPIRPAPAPKPRNAGHIQPRSSKQPCATRGF